MNKKRTIDFFFKRVEDVVHDPEIQTQTQPQPQTQKEAQPQTETQTNADNVMRESLKKKLNRNSLVWILSLSF